MSIIPIVSEGMCRQNLHIPSTRTKLYMSLCQVCRLLDIKSCEKRGIWNVPYSKLAHFDTSAALVSCHAILLISARPKPKRGRGKRRQVVIC